MYAVGAAASLCCREDGGSTYHQRYRTHEFVRGQEGDWWKGDVDKLRGKDFPKHDIFPPENALMPKKRQDAINREYMPTSKDHYQHKTFSLHADAVMPHGGSRWRP